MSWERIRVARAASRGVLAALLVAGLCAASADAGTTTAPLSVTVHGSGTVTGSGIDCQALCSSSYPIPATSLIGFGHSVVAGTGASNPATTDFMSLVAGDLGATDYNFGIGGSEAAYPDGWAWTLENYVPGTNAANTPPASTYVAYYGLNDLAALGGPSYLGPFEQGLASIIARLDSVAVYEDNDRSVSAPSTWTSYSVSGENSGSTVLVPYAHNSPLTITVPSNFQGGTIALGFTAAANSANPTGQTVYDVRVDNGTTSTYTINGPTMVTPEISGNGNVIGTIDRISGLTPGAHKITIALASSTGTISTAFDYWEAEAPFNESRPMIVPLQYDLPTAGYQDYTTWGYVPDDASVQVLNSDILSVVSSFPANVQTVQLNLDKNLADLSPDQLHPDDAGYTIIAQQVMAALSTVTLTATPSAGYTFTGWSGGGCSGTGTCTASISSARSVTATFTKGRA
jgi:hypothetical protein